MKDEHERECGGVPVAPGALRLHRTAGSTAADPQPRSKTKTKPPDVSKGAWPASTLNSHGNVKKKPSKIKQKSTEDCEVKSPAAEKALGRHLTSDLL